jgi:DNA-binding HxlR family transcriptional regulator
VAKALDVVGERWTLLVVRNLLLGPLRYSDLHRGLPGITTNLLAKRLKEMEESGLVERIRAGASESSYSYRLTDLGHGLEPVVQALGAWGWHWMTGPGPAEHRDLEWLLVGARRRYKGGASLAAEFVVDSAPYHVILAGEAATIGRGPLPRPELRVRLDGPTLIRLLLEGWPANGLPDSVEVEGGVDRFRYLIDAFEPPGVGGRGEMRTATTPPGPKIIITPPPCLPATLSGP